MLALTLLIVFLSVCYFVLTRNYGYWKKMGVPCLSPSLIFGNMKDVIFVKKTIFQLIADVYNSYPDASYVGFYKVRQPAIVIRDPALIEDILIKEFSSFHDNDIHLDEDVDPVFGKNPFALKGDRWKDVRNLLTPFFTVNKIKSIYPLINKIAENLVAYLEQNTQVGKSKALEAKELSTKYTTDVVASCVFGLEGQSFINENNDFLNVANKVAKTNFIRAVQIVLVKFVPSLANILKIGLISAEVRDYFRSVISETIKYRKLNNIVRGDALDLMFERTLTDSDFGEDDVLAHMVGFYADGVETSAISLSYALFELAANPDVQLKLRVLIDEVFAKYDGNPSYESLMEIEYLDNALFESLRKHPPAGAMSRVCTKSFTLPSPFGIGKGKDIVIEPGTPIFIPIYAIHNDPKYYPDPEKFDPDRFALRNKKFRTNCTFLSFGDGPRTCLGQRFGIAQTKIAIANIVANFEITLNKATCMPLQVDPQHFLMKAAGGVWLNFKKRA